MKKLRFQSRVNIWKYIKDADNPQGKKDEDPEEEEKEKSGAQAEMFENVVSQNPKINYQIIQGFAENIATNKNLIHFTLVNYRLSPMAWESLGRGLGAAKNLRHFACNACNLNQEAKNRLDETQMIPNLQLLIQGMLISVKKPTKMPKNVNWDSKK